MSNDEDEDEIKSNNVYSGEHSDLRLRDEDKDSPNWLDGVSGDDTKIPSVMGNVGYTNPIPYPLDKGKRRNKIEICEKEDKLREVQEEIRLKEQESERLKKEINEMTLLFVENKQERVKLEKEFRKKKIFIKEKESERLKKEIQLLSSELIDDSESRNQDLYEPPFPDGFWNISPLVKDD